MGLKDVIKDASGSGWVFICSSRGSYIDLVLLQDKLCGLGNCWRICAVSKRKLQSFGVTTNLYDQELSLSCKNKAHRGVTPPHKEACSRGEDKRAWDWNNAIGKTDSKGKTIVFEHAEEVVQPMNHIKQHLKLIKWNSTKRHEISS
ncbi:LOW QUALITY PROTEIN: hypothetical protein V2J09_008468 [Rumex salicifolius]